MIAMRPCTDPAAMSYFQAQLALPQGDFLYIAMDSHSGELLGGASFSTTGGVALLLGMGFTNAVDSALTDGLLRASLNFGELEQGCPRYCISPADPLADKLAQLGYQVGEDASIALFFSQSHHCGH